MNFKMKNKNEEKSFVDQVNKFVIISVVIISNVIFVYSAEIPSIVLPEKEFVVFQLELAFRNSKMITAKIIDHLEYKRVGIYKGDILNFEAVLTPKVTLNDEQYNWSGEKVGTSPSISITFNTTGNITETLTCSQITRSAIITVVYVSPPNRDDWSSTHPVKAALVWLLAQEAQQWAGYYVSEGGHNGRGDAARHAYWNVLMTVEMDVETAEGAATSHERSNYEESGSHNEIVMDLENNDAGRNIGTGLSPGATRTDCQNAVINSLNEGNLTILDNLNNENEIGLLQPSDK